MNNYSNRCLVIVIVVVSTAIVSIRYRDYKITKQLFSSNVISNRFAQQSFNKTTEIFVTQQTVLIKQKPLKNDTQPQRLSQPEKKIENNVLHTTTSSTKLETVNTGSTKIVHDPLQGGYHKTKTDIDETIKRNILLKLTKHRKTSPTNIKASSQNYVSVKAGGRLGNKLFQAASLIGIALENQMIPIHPTIHKFENSTYSLKHFNQSKIESLNWTIIYEPYCDHKVMNISQRFPNQNVLLRRSYLQCYTFFDKHTEEVRQHLTFSDDVVDNCAQFYQKADIRIKQQLFRNNTIGIHVRRGDMNSPAKRAKGYNPPDVTYYKHARDYFCSKLQRDLIFVVCGDDIAWAKANIKPLHTQVIFTEKNDREVDMAILAACDHVIMSVGTFGWWAGYFSEGQVVYFKNNPLPNTLRGKGYSHHTFFPPYYVGLE